MKRGFLAWVVSGFFCCTLNCYAADWFYTVRPGDTIWDLCLQYTDETNCWRKLDKLNEIEDSRQLPPGFVVRIPVDWLKTAPKPVTVGDVRGEVTAARQEEQKTWPLDINDELSLGTTITTFEGSTQLQFADGSDLQVTSNSELILDTLSTFEGKGIVDSKVRLNKGAVIMRITPNPKNRFEIVTPSAVVAVRGTVFNVSVSEAPAQTRCEVFEGKVEVSTKGESVIVPAGYGIVAKPNQALGKPQPLLPAPAISASKNNNGLIRWPATVGANMFQLDILQDNNSNILIKRILTQEQSFDIKSLPAGCYRVRVRRLGDDGLTSLAQDQRLCHGDMEKKSTSSQTPHINTSESQVKTELDTKPALETPPEKNSGITLVAPVLNKSNLSSPSKNNVVLHWADVEGASSYRIQIAKDIRFKHIVKEGTTTARTFEFSTKRTVFVRIQAIAEDNQSDFSEALQWELKTPHVVWKALVFLGVVVLAAL